jgi:DNA-binding response OmpR family regulator
MALKLLIAEDERELSDVLVTILSSSGYTTEAVYDGGSALEKCLQSQFDGIVLDVMMPVMNGFEVLRELRCRRVETPVIILSAKSEVEDKVKGLEDGANDYLPKPFATDELLARIKAMLRKPLESPPLSLAIGNVSLDGGEFSIRCGKSSVRLSLNEYKMMEILAHSPGVHIKAERFMSEIWENSSNAQPSVVWLYASYLQKKISAIGGDLIIQSELAEASLSLELADAAPSEQQK